MLTIYTPSRVSLNDTTRAIEAIGEYLASRDYRHIQSAGAAIDSAIQADGNYALAVFYRGVVHDLAGTPADAVPFFQRVLAECEDAQIKEKSIFNLGIAFYHQYSHRWLQQAEKYFQQILEDSKDSKLIQLGRAHLAQVYAMWMRPAADEIPPTPPILARIQQHFEECQVHANVVLKSSKESQVRAIAFNALGMAQMYITDYVITDASEKKTYLLRAQEYLEKAAKTLPGDWANTCDLASLSLRRGVTATEPQLHEKETQFAIAKAHLERVVTTLRPNYGFAFHELGILHRVWGKWDEALAYQNRAKSIPIAYRDIGDEKIAVEVEAISNRDLRYPLIGTRR